MMATKMDQNGQSDISSGDRVRYHKVHELSAELAWKLPASVMNMNTIAVG